MVIRINLKWVYDYECNIGRSRSRTVEARSCSIYTDHPLDKVETIARNHKKDLGGNIRDFCIVSAEVLNGDKFISKHDGKL